MGFKTLIYIVLLIISVFSYLKTEAQEFVDKEEITQAHQEALYSDQEVIDWAEKHIPEIMKLDFGKTKEQVKAIDQYFTKSGARSFKAALDTSRVLDSVEANMQIVRTEVLEFPRVIKSEIKEGVYSWTLEVPMRVTYSAQEKSRSDKLLTTLIIQRTSQTKYNIGIQQWVSRFIDT